jgi:hypothetical protein
MKKNLSIVVAFLAFTSISFAQEDTLGVEVITEETYVDEVIDSNLVEETFHGTRVINGHSVETLRKGVLEFRVEHRFGDIAGTYGGIQSMYGFDNSSDIRIAFEYGITNDLMVGFGRSKGTGAPYKSLLDGFVKYKVIKQERHGSPFTLTALATTSYSYMTASTDISQVNAFPKWEYRLAYCTQLNIARKFGERLSLAVLPTLVHRNYVAQNDVNTLFSLGGAARFGINSKMAVLVEYYHVFADEDVRGTNYNSLGIAFEWITFGHNFTVNLTNSKGFGETQFIPYTFENWLKGQFRLGFCVGRKFERE